MHGFFLIFKIILLLGIITNTTREVIYIYKFVSFFEFL